MDYRREMRPTREAQSEPTTKATSSSLPPVDVHAVIHAAHTAGYELGKMERFEFEVEDYARALLHQRAREMLGFARRLAAVKGPAWEAMIVWSGEADD
jgi:hypothetical protein